MMPKIYTPTENKQKPMPLLTITEKMGVIAVDENGELLAMITSGACCKWAKENLEEQGYDTSRAKWDDDGAFVRLK